MGVCMGSVCMEGSVDGCMHGRECGWVCVWVVYAWLHHEMKVGSHYLT